MATRYRYGSCCRACGADGRFPYMTVMNTRVALCTGCAADYVNAELKCDARAVDCEREANRLAALRAGVDVRRKS